MTKKKKATLVHKKITENNMFHFSERKMSQQAKNASSYTATKYYVITIMER